MGYVSTPNRNRPPTGTVPGIGPKNGVFCFVGEAPARDEFKLGKPFVGMAGNVFDNCLQSTGIVRSMNYVTNFVKEFVDYRRNGMNLYVQDRAKPPRLTERGLEWQRNLANELESVEAQAIFAMGNPALLALTGKYGISARRGYVTESLPMFGRRPVMPTLHPASCLYGKGNYIGKYYIEHDFIKMRDLMLRMDDTGLSPLEYDPQEHFFPTTISEVKDVIDRCRKAKVFCFDIEASQSSNYEVSCIGFSTSRNWAGSILLNDPQMWSAEEELEIWRMIASILEDTSLVKIGQNLLFDIHHLIMKQSIFTKPPIIDTMVGHHIIYPDFLKGLGFLASIHTHRQYWKDMVKFKGKHKEED